MLVTSQLPIQTTKIFYSFLTGTFVTPTLKKVPPPIVAIYFFLNEFPFIHTTAKTILTWNQYALVFSPVDIYFVSAAAAPNVPKTKIF